MKKEDLPLYHVALGRALLVVAEFPDTEEGAKQANAYMDAHPGIGVLEARNGRVILASNEDKGIPAGGPALRMTCACCGSVARARQWHNQDTGYGLCVACIDYCGRNVTPEYFQRTYGLRGVHYDIPEQA